MWSFLYLCYIYDLDFCLNLTPFHHIDVIVVMVRRQIICTLDSIIKCYYKLVIS